MTDKSGMTPREEWVKTPIHQASSYTCGKCGLRFPDPDALYDHIDAEHANDKR